MDPRRFISWDVPALQASAALLFDAYHAGDAADMRAAVVALPGARAGRRLKELLIDEAARRGVRLVPPRITTAGALPELLYEPFLPLVEPSLARRLWARQLRALDAGSLATVFPHAPAAADLRGWLQLAREMERLHALVGAGGLHFGDVVGACGGELLYNDEARWRVLARVQDGWYDALHSMGRTDRDAARRRALADGAVKVDGDVWLIGVVDLPGAARALLHALLAVDATRLHVLVHAPEELEGAFDVLGGARPEIWRSTHIPLRDEQLSVVGHPSNQAAAAVRAIAAFGGRYAADEIVVAVPDEEVVPYLEQRLAGAGVHARYAGGAPVERTAPYRLLAAIAEYLGSSASESLAALVRHPDLAEPLRRRGAAGDTLLDRYLGRRLPAQLHARSDADGAVGAVLGALHRDDLLGGLRGKRRLGEWMAPVLDLVATVYAERYGDEALRREVPRERRVMDLFRMLRDAAAAHMRIAPAHDDVCDAAAAIRILLDDVRGGLLPSDADEAAVELLGWLELHLDDAPAAILTGMNEPFVPEAVNADAFLPNTLRTRLGLDDNDRRYARYAYQLTAVLQSRADVHVIAGRRTVLGDPIRPSRLLLTEGGEALARRIASFLDSDTAHVQEPMPAGAPDHDRTAFMLPPEPVLHLDPPDSISISAFKGLIADPYQFALDRLFRLEIVDDAARELDALEFGNFAHDVMQAFGATAAASSTDDAVIAAELDALLDSHAQARFGSGPQPAVRVQVEQLRLRLRALARTHAAWVTDGWRIVAAEAKTPDEGVPFVVDGEPIRLRGRIDRIDYNAETGMWALLDYKTGDVAKPPEETHCGPARDGVV
ncbi:MAG TPA: PD-(D/E)XK nuclease family protein, partial [Longimicrobiales bacterium]|nr:PD-(D/E)XK nuclease family protein [Longimicrobiales bacterium]